MLLAAAAIIVKYFVQLLSACCNHCIAKMLKFREREREKTRFYCARCVENSVNSWYFVRFCSFHSISFHLVWILILSALHTIYDGVNVHYLFFRQTETERKKHTHTRRAQPEKLKLRFSCTENSTISRLLSINVFSMFRHSAFLRGKRAARESVCSTVLLILRCDLCEFHFWQMQTKTRKKKEIFCFWHLVLLEFWVSEWASERVCFCVFVVTCLHVEKEKEKEKKCATKLSKPDGQKWSRKKQQKENKSCNHRARFPDPMSH